MTAPDRPSAEKPEVPWRCPHCIARAVRPCPHSAHNWRNEVAGNAARPAEAGEHVDERDAFKASHRHFDLSETQDEWGQTTFTHSHIDAMWCGWKARADQALAAAKGGDVTDKVIEAVKRGRSVHAAYAAMLAAAPAAPATDAPRVTGGPLEREVRAWLDGDAKAVRVHEGGAAENLAASFAVNIARVTGGRSE